MSAQPRRLGDVSTKTDLEVVDLVRGGDTAAYEVLMRRHNERVYRAARAVLGRDDEAEDAAQAAWLAAWRHLDAFAGRSQFSTWLLRIAVREAIGLRRQRGRLRRLAVEPEDILDHAIADPHERDPEQSASGGELGAVIQDAVDRLPPTQRAAFVLRDVEGLTTGEASDVLDISETALKVRLHRARATLRHDLELRIGAELRSVYGFDGDRCDRIVERVLAQLPQSPQ